MKILLAGATGVVGRLLMSQLVSAGHKVTGTTRSEARAEMITRLGGRPVLLDALDRDAVLTLLRVVRPDVVIHQLTDLATRDWAANSRLRIDGTRNLVDAAQAVGVERMIAQSISWVTVPGDRPAHETDPLDLAAPPPRDETIAGVAALERAVLELPVGVVLRYGRLYGAGTWYARNGWNSERILQGEVSATEAVVSFLHVEDAAAAALWALDAPAGVYNIVDDEPASGWEWLPVYAKLIDAPPPRIAAGRERWERGESNAKARELGWRPHYPTWREGFAAVLRTEQETG